MNRRGWGRIWLVDHARALNGEQPLWDAARNRLWWLDVRSPALHALDPATGGRQSWNMPAWVGARALLPDGRLVLALRTGLFAFEPQSGALSPLAPPPYDPRRFCFNDSGCDSRGRLLLGAMAHSLGPETSQGPDTQPLWIFERGRQRPVSLPPVTIANGFAFSPDCRTLYHTDTAAKTIFACDYDVEAGEAANQRVFARVEEGGPNGGPDGAAVDSEGFYTCAVFGGGVLLRFDPQGQLERRFELPVKYPTMPAYGGEDLRTLYVTSARFPWSGDEDDHPDAGSLFALDAPVPGNALPCMAPVDEDHR